jgi:hypothetical protein
MLEAVAREPRLFDATLRAYFAEDPALRPLVDKLRHLGGLYVHTGLGTDTSRAADIARVLDPLSLAMAIRISSGHSTGEHAIEEFRRAVELLVKE